MTARPPALCLGDIIENARWLLCRNFPGGWLRPHLERNRRPNPAAAGFGPTGRSPVESLSGGNQQRLYWPSGFRPSPKFASGRAHPRVDVGAKQEIYELMNQDPGGHCDCAITSEMPELLAMSDRILRCTAHYGTTAGRQLRKDPQCGLGQQWKEQATMADKLTEIDLCGGLPADQPGDGALIGSCPRADLSCGSAFTNGARSRHAAGGFGVRHSGSWNDAGDYHRGHRLSGPFCLRRFCLPRRPFTGSGLLADPCFCRRCSEEAAGFLIGRFKIQPFIATLADGFARAWQWVSGGQKISTAVQQPDGTYRYAMSRTCSI